MFKNKVEVKRNVGVIVKLPKHQFGHFQEFCVTSLVVFNMAEILSQYALDT